MNEGWTTGRVIIVFLLGLILVTLWMILRSLDHQQEKIIELRREIEEVQARSVRVEGLDRIVLEVRGSGGPVRIDAAPGTGAGSDSTGAARFGDGKDAIGRPLEATPGFTIEPPPGAEIPGRTTARQPAFIPPRRGTFIFGWMAEPGLYNYYLTNDGMASVIDEQVHERLFTVNPDNPQELWPELAVAWETGDDGLTYRFHLRRGVTFSDGSPFDADDVIFSYNLVADPDVKSESRKSSFNDVASVRKIDPLTVEVRMRRKYWKALKQFGYALRIFPQEYYERKIPAVARERGIERFSVTPLEPGFAEVFNLLGQEMPPGTGPYTWVEGQSRVVSQHVTLFANGRAWLRALNPDHYRLERLRWRWVRDRVSMIEAFRKGLIHVVSVEHSMWEDQLENDPTITGIADRYEYDHTRIGFSHITFNCRRPPFDDVRVRRAIAHLVDRERIWKDMERGRGQIATCPTKPIYREYSHDIEPRRFDPQLAARLLDEAGWKDSDGDGVRDRGGVPLRFELTVPAGRTWYDTIGVLVNDACKSVGVDCTIDKSEWSQFTEALFNREFDAICLLLSPEDPWMDPYDNFHSSQGIERAGNHAGWKNEEVDRLLEAMRREFDDEKRAEMFHRFNRHFHEDVPMLLLTHGRVGALINKKFGGVRIGKTGLRPTTIWLKDDAKDDDS